MGLASDTILGQPIYGKVDELLSLNGGRPFTQLEALKLTNKIIDMQRPCRDLLQEVKEEIEEERQDAALLKDKLNQLVKLPRYIADIMLMDAYTSEQIYYVLAILSEVNTNGIIRDFSPANMLKVLAAKFDYKYACRSTIYQVHDAIINKKGTPIFAVRDGILTVLDYNKAFSTNKKLNNGGAVSLPAFFFREKFRNLNITALRMALYFTVRITDTSAQKIVYFKWQEAIKAANLKKRCKSDLAAYIEELQPYMDIRDNSVSIRPEWHMTKAVVEQLRGTVQSANVIHNKKAQYILSLLKHQGGLQLLRGREYKYSGIVGYEDTSTKAAFNTIVGLLHTLDNGNIVRVIVELGKKLADPADPIRSIGAFVRDLVKKHIKGLTDPLKSIKWFRDYFRYLKDVQGFSIKRDFPDLAVECREIVAKYIAECRSNINHHRQKEYIRRQYGLA